MTTIFKENWKYSVHQNKAFKHWNKNQYSVKKRILKKTTAEGGNT